MPEDALSTLFDNKAPSVRATYDKVLSVLSTSVHLVHKTTFAGAHPKKAWLDLTIRSEKPIRSDRVRAQEQVSKNRWHQDVRLTSVEDVDAEVVNWLKSAHALAGG